MPKEELKPCPFCGIKPESRHVGLFYFIEHYCSKRVKIEVYGDAQEVIDEWNKRYEK